MIQNYALLIGVNETQSQIVPKLEAAICDVYATEAILKEYCNFPQENITKLIGKEATKQNILDHLDQLKEKVANGADKFLFIFYSGHGHQDVLEGSKKYYLIPYDISPNLGLDNLRNNEVLIRETGLPGEAFAEKINSLKPDRLFLALDCCHAGGNSGLIKGTKKIFVPFAFDPNAVFTEEEVKAYLSKNSYVQKGKGRAVLSSSRAQQSSYIDPNSNLSVFTYHLLDEIIQPDSGAVLRIMAGVSEKVQASAQKMHVEQSPHHYFIGESFEIGVEKRNTSSDLYTILKKLNIECVKSLTIMMTEKDSLRRLLEEDILLEVVNKYWSKKYGRKTDELVDLSGAEEISGGYSSCTVWTIPDNKKPTLIAKIGPSDEIAKEKNGNKYLTEKWGDWCWEGEVIEISDNEILGSFISSSVGHVRRQILTLEGYFIKQDPVQINGFIDKMFEPKTLRDNWTGGQTLKVEARLRASYDPILPVNLVCIPYSEKTSGRPSINVIDANSRHSKFINKVFKLGEILTLKNFRVIEIQQVLGEGKDQKKYFEITLNIKTFPEQKESVVRLSNSYRIRLNYYAKELPEAIRINELLPEITVIVTETRNSFFEQIIKSYIPKVNINEDKMNLIIAEEQIELTNPLEKYKDILEEVHELMHGRIHGDLNLRNVLISRPGEANEKYYYIDCSHARYDHFFHDLLRFEIFLIIKVLAKQEMVTRGNAAQTIFKLYEGIHKRIVSDGKKAPFVATLLGTIEYTLIKLRQVAFELNGKDTLELYNKCLALYLLSALKYDDDDPEINYKGRLLAFWGAATILALTNISVPKLPQSLPPEHDPPVTQDCSSEGPTSIIDEIAEVGYGQLAKGKQIETGILTKDTTQLNPLRLKPIMGKELDVYLGKKGLYIKGKGNWNKNDNESAIFFRPSQDVQLQKAFKRCWYGQRTKFKNLLNKVKMPSGFIFEDETILYVVKYMPLQGGTPFYLILILMS